MNLNDMLIFSAVVTNGSFTAAAEVLGVPKSNVSRSVKRLEKALGVQLLERTTRSHALTEIGQIYYDHSLRMIEEVEAANASIEKITLSPKGKLRVCVSVTVGQSMLSPNLAAFVKSYPDVKLDLRLVNRRVDMLEEGFDVVIRVGELADSNLTARRLCTRRLCLYASPDYLNAVNTSLNDPDDLAHHACLYMNAAKKRAKWILRHGSEYREVKISPQFVCDDFNVICQMTIDGAGIALLPDYLCVDFVKDGRLVPVLEEWVCGEVDFHVMVPSRRGITPKVRVFIDHLQATLGRPL